MSDVTLEKCCQFIGLYEPSTEARVNNQLLLDGTVCKYFSPISRLFVESSLKFILRRTCSRPLALDPPSALLVVRLLRNA